MPKADSHTTRRTTVWIWLDDEQKVFEKGSHSIEMIKRVFGVPERKVISLITPTGLTEQDDKGKVELKAKMRFCSHVRTGGSA